MMILMDIYYMQNQMKKNIMNVKRFIGNNFLSFLLLFICLFFL